jgi:hypothetical protein
MTDKTFDMSVLERPSQACDCSTCVNMCLRRPCWPTPAEAKAIIDAGFAGELMLDFWSGIPGKPKGEERTEEDYRDVYILCGAVVGPPPGLTSSSLLMDGLLGDRDWDRRGRGAPYWPEGRCAFLGKDHLCKLHDKGLKPIEGRLAMCTDEAEAEGGNLHEAVAVLWDSEEGRAVVKMWHEKLESAAGE